MPDKRHELFARALEVSDLGPGSMALRLGITVRTTQRWRLGTGVVHNRHLAKLADLVQAKDPALAREILDEIDDFHRRNRLPFPPRPDLDAVQNEPEVRLANDVVASAARVLGVPVDKARSALRGALARAQGGGLTLDALMRAIDRGAPR